MSAVVDKYSRAVLWTKIALPLLALGMLSTLFMFAETFDPDRAIPISDNTLAQLMAAKGLQAPKFSGITAAGHLIDASATSFTPKSNDKGYDAANISARISLAEDNNVSFHSPSGEINRADRIVRLSGGVSLTSSLGYSIRTEEIVGTIDLDRIFTPGLVEVHGGPLGNFTAGSMEIQQVGKDDEDRTLFMIFKDGVRLVYIPQTER